MNAKTNKTVIAFLTAKSDSDLGRDYRLHRCLTLAASLCKRNEVVILGKGFSKKSVEEVGAEPVAVDFADMEGLSVIFQELQPDIVIFDLDVVPLPFTFFLRGLGAITFSIDHFSETMSVADIRINTCRPDVDADFAGLDYWVPNILSQAQTQAGVCEGALDEHPPESGTVFSLPEIMDQIPAWLGKLFDALRQRGILFRVIARNSALQNAIPAEYSIGPDAVVSAQLVVNIGLANLFDLMSLSVAVAHVGFSAAECKRVAELLPKGGVFDLGVAGEDDPEDMADSIAHLLAEQETLDWHNALASSLVSNDNIDKMTGILSLVDQMKWDSEYFGFPVAILNTFRLTKPIVRFAMQFCEKRSIRLLQYLCDCHDRNSVLMAERYGFNFTDMRLTFERFLDRHFLGSELPDGYTFDIGRKSDIKRLMQIADGLYKAGRYHFDTNFPRDKVRLFYQDWVRKAVLALFDDIAYVLRHGENPVGFCTVKFDPCARARIRLVGLDPAFSGMRLGEIMLGCTLKSLCERGVRYVQVSTQGRNYPAQRMYQKAGFVTKKTELWYHKWFLEKEMFRF